MKRETATNKVGLEKMHFGEQRTQASDFFSNLFRRDISSLKKKDFNS